MSKLNLWRRTAPGPEAMPQPRIGAAALHIAEARGDVRPCPDMFARGAMAKGALALMLLRFEHGASYLNPRHDYRPLGVTTAEVEALLREWSDHRFFRVYAGLQGGEYAIFWPDADCTWPIGWRGIAAVLAHAEAEIGAGGPLASQLDRESIRLLRLEWGVARAKPGESGEIVSVDDIEVAGQIG